MRPAKVASMDRNIDVRGAKAVPPARDIMDGRGVLVYVHRPIGALQGTVRLSLEDDPAVIGRRNINNKNESTAPTRRTGYWAVPHKWEDLPAAWKNQQQPGRNSEGLLRLELSGNSLTWQRLPMEEWENCCHLMCGSGPFLSSFPSGTGTTPKQPQGRRTFLSSSKNEPPRRPIAWPARSGPRNVVCVPSIRFLDGGPTAEQQEVLLRHLHPRSLEIGGDGLTTVGGAVRRALGPLIVGRQHQQQQLHDDPNDDETHDSDDESLRDLVINGPTLDADDCRAVAQLLTPDHMPPSPTGGVMCRGGPRTLGAGLRTLALRHVTFVSREAWNLLCDAMRSSPSLEGVTWDRILFCQDATPSSGSGDERQSHGRQRLDPADSDDSVDDPRSRAMEKLRDELTTLHAFNALHRVACSAIQSLHQPTRRHCLDNQQPNRRQKWRESVDAIDSAIEVLRQWYLSPSSGPAAPSREKLALLSSPPQPQPPQQAPSTTTASPPPPKVRTTAHDPRRARLPPPGCS